MTATATAAVTLQHSSSSSIKAPTAETFSFKAPFLPASLAGSSKQRRTSLALPASPKVVLASAWSFRDDTDLEEKKKNGKLRKIDVDSSEGMEEWQEKKVRKKWSPEETQMLVDGCNKHGVGNWKTILSDPTLSFDNRSPVDLKDRFRTYYPDAYKRYYPNARTHLSTKIRSTLPDGSSLFEKTRSKKRRPFTEEEDRALKAGYEKHGTVWATIVKDPVFQEQNRRSTDLRDRFRNAFPELYQAAGYKPRTSSKKKAPPAPATSACVSETAATTPVLISGPSTPAPSPRKAPIRAATDDQIAMSTTGPIRVQTRRRRRNTSQGLLFRGGTKSVPQSNAPSEDEDSSGEEDDEVVKPPRTTRSTSNPHSANGWNHHKPSPSSFSSFSSSPVTSTTATDDDEADNAMDTSLGGGDYGNNTNNGGMTMMIGKSAWGTQDWFSPNPRLDNSTSNTSSSSTYVDGGGGLSPSSPFSTFSSPLGFSLQTLNSLNSESLLNPMSNHNFNLVPSTSDSHEHNGHGVFDRYDLVPPTANPYHSYSHSHVNSMSSSSSFAPYDVSFSSSDFGLGDDYDSRSAFSDEWVGGMGGGGLFSSSMSMDGSMGMSGSAAPSGGRGFTHHSDYAGDLIFSARTHQPVHQPFAVGLGLSGMTLPASVSVSEPSQNSGIHPSQLHTQPHAHSRTDPHSLPHTHTHTPALSALPGIDEIELRITLEDTIMTDPSSSAARATEHDVGIMPLNMDILSSASGSRTSPPEMLMAEARTHGGEMGAMNAQEQVAADLSGQHQQRRQQRAGSNPNSNSNLFNADTIRRRNARSQSAMSEYRLPKPLAFEDLVDLESHDFDGEDGDGGRHGRGGLGRGIEDRDEIPFDDDDDEEHLTPPATPLTQPRQLRGLRKSARRLGIGSGGPGGSSASTHGRSISVPPVDRVGMESPTMTQVHHLHSQPDANIRSSRHLSMSERTVSSSPSSSQPQRQASTSPSPPEVDLSTPAAAAQIPLPNPPTFASLFLAAQADNNLYDNLPFLDLHYFGGNGNGNPGVGGLGTNQHMNGPGGVMPTIWDASSAETLGSESSRQALDLAQSTRSTPSSTGMGINSTSPSLSVGRGVTSSGFTSGNLQPQTLTHSPHPPVVRSHSLSHAHSQSHSTPLQQSHSMQHVNVNMKSHRPGHAGHQRGLSTGNLLTLGTGTGSSVNLASAANASVCPQDLMLRNGSDSARERSERNKRKRASWDGANV
ncbi:hypothetical protein D9757_008353 [Collybiopsis confluens]|uniref:Meiotically up-regulated gene 152 protein n=1 Tax=Collybiopsis confluens TaxID=2823264 RepID=A0A8H5HEV9_9AGAR|nr:hypothetical protein D9757_008353 [Collybiopsis confluens]